MTTADRESAPDRGWEGRVRRGVGILLLIPVFAVIVAGLTIAVPAYAVIVLVVNIVGYGSVFLRKIGRRVVGTAIVQKRLEGRIVAAKEDVLRVGLELYAVDRFEEPQEPAKPLITDDDLETFRTLVGYEEGASKTLYEFSVPGLERYRQWRDRSDTDRTPRAVLEYLTGPSSGESGDREEWEAPPDTVWAITAMELLNRASEALWQNTETAYRAFLRAERAIVYGEYLLYRRRRELDPEADDPAVTIRTHARIVLAEALARDGESTPVVRDLLCGDAPPGQDPELKASLSAFELDRAMAVLNTDRLEDFRRLESLRVTILGFVGLPALVLVAILAFAPTLMGDSLGPVTATLAVQPVTVPRVGWTLSPYPEQLFFGLVLAFGAIGAAISGTRTIERDSGSLRTLGEILGYWLAFVRMVIGAISAFIVSIFLFSGLVETGMVNLPMVLGISLAAGFSERLAIRAISSFETRAIPETTRRRREREL